MIIVEDILRYVVHVQVTYYRNSVCRYVNWQDFNAHFDFIVDMASLGVHLTENHRVHFFQGH